MVCFSPVGYIWRSIADVPSVSPSSEQTEMRWCVLN